MYVAESPIFCTINCFSLTFTVVIVSSYVWVQTEKRSKVAQCKLARVYCENKSSKLKIVCLLFCKYQVNTKAAELAQK